MSITLKLKRGTEAAVDAATLSDWEIAYATDSKKIVVFDGETKQKYLEASDVAPASHPHAEADITDLGDYALSGHNHDSSYSATGHTHNYASTTHASGHLSGQSDEIDGDKLDIDWNPTHYTPATVESYADSVDNLTAHLKGIDNELGSSSGITTGKAIAMSIVFG